SPLLLDDRRLLLSAGPVRQRGCAQSRARPGADHGGGGEGEGGRGKPRPLADARNERGGTRALRQAGAAARLHPISQDLLTCDSRTKRMAALAAAVRPSRRFFLGVERSVCGRAWCDRLDERGAARALSIVQRHGMPELLARVLAGRGVEPEDAESFL